MINNNKTIDKVYKKYKKAINMTYNEFLIWSKNPLSKKASLDRRPIRRNLRLLKRSKKDWTMTDVREANKVISYLARAKKIKSKNYVGKTGLTKNDIALRNWAYDKFKK